MTVASSLAGVSVRCARAMPRTTPPADSGSDTHTIALNRLTAGSQTVGGMPVIASQPLVSSAVPAFAAVFTPPMIDLSQTSALPSASAPVPSYQRGALREKFVGVPTADRQSAAV